MSSSSPFRRVIDFCLTVVLWGYFLFGYLVLLPIVWIPYYLICRNMRAAMQKLNHLHLKTFFALARLTIPRTVYAIDPAVRALRGSVIVCNHLSYLDPILLVSLYPRQTTIVKKTFFRVPIFGWFLRKAGYIPSSVDEMTGPGMIDHLDAISAHLAQGGNLFVFPEGTRSRDGKLSSFNRGAFSIARYCRTDVQLVLIRNSDRLFRPGTFIFNAAKPNTISLEWFGLLKPYDSAEGLSISTVTRQARRRFEEKIAATQAPPSEGCDTINE